MTADREQERGEVEDEGMGAVFWVAIACLLSALLVFSLMVCAR